MRRTVKALLGVAVVWGVVFVVMMAWPTRSGGDGVMITTLGKGVATPDDFRFLMFPRGEVQLRDAPDGTVVGTLARAVANTHREIDEGGWVRVGVPDGAAWVRLDELTYMPTVDFTPMVRGWQQWANSSDSAIAEAWTEIGPGSRPEWTRATLHLTWRGSDPEDGADWTEYVYETDGRRVDPIQQRDYSAKMSAIVGGARVIVAMVFATITSGLMAGTVWAFRRAARARKPVTA